MLPSWISIASWRWNRPKIRTKATQHGARSASRCFAGASTLVGLKPDSRLAVHLRNRRLGLLMSGVDLHDLLVGLLHSLFGLPVLHQHPVHHAANQVGAC